MSENAINEASFTSGSNARPLANTALSYLYRDASNYKQHADVIFSGALTLDEAHQLLNAMDEEDSFVPSAVGLNDLQDMMCSDWDPEEDHPLHEIDGLALTDKQATETQTAQAFLNAFLNADWNAAADAVMAANAPDEDGNDE